MMLPAPGSLHECGASQCTTAVTASQHSQSVDPGQDLAIGLVWETPSEAPVQNWSGADMRKGPWLSGVPACYTNLELSPPKPQFENQESRICKHLGVLIQSPMWPPCRFSHVSCSGRTKCPALSSACLCSRGPRDGVRLGPAC